MPSDDVSRTLPNQDFVAFYRAQAEPLLRFFTRRVYDAQVALDLTAETFAEAYKSRNRFRGDSEDQSAAWLYGIARHQLSAYLRHGKAERRALERLGLDLPSADDAELERVEELADLRDLRMNLAKALGGREAEIVRESGELARASIRTALEDLAAEQREAIELRVIDELAYGEVASRLGISEQRARARVSRGLRALANALEFAERQET